MQTRQWSVACLVIVVGLAGCSGLSPFGGNQSGTATDTHDISYPEGYNESGVTDLETAINQHESTLSDSDSYALGINSSTEISIFNASINIEVIENKTEDKGVLSMDMEAEDKSIVEMSKYNSDNTTYKMNKTRGEPTRYQTYPAMFGSETIFDESLVSGWISNATFGEASRVTHNGEQVFQYEVTDADSAEPFVMEFADNPTLNEFNGTLTVDENGVVRSFSYTMNYTTADGTEKPMNVDYRTIDLNSTTVEEPDWVATAREQN